MLTEKSWAKMLYSVEIEPVAVVTLLMKVFNIATNTVPSIDQIVKIRLKD